MDSRGEGPSGPYTRFRDDDAISQTSEDKFDTISTVSDYIVIDTNNKQNEPSRIRVNKYSYPCNAYLPGGDGTSEDSSEEEEEESEIDSVIQNPAYSELAKPAVSVEDELDQRKQEQQKEAEIPTVVENGKDAKDDDDDDSGDEEEEGEEPKAAEAEEPESPTVPGEDVLQSEPQSLLIQAVKNDTPHMIDGLLSETNKLTIYASLLYSIILGRDHITKMFLEHHTYESLKEIIDMAKVGNMPHTGTDGEEKDEDTEQLLTAEFTPIMLASVKNQFEIVQGMMSKGETIEEPHALGCSCKACRLQTDEIKAAKTRINTYKALCSDAYVVLASVDPIYRTFELGQKLKTLANEEKHFKAEYLQLAEHCSKLSARILDRVRDGGELDTLLNEKYGAGPVASDLARLKLAIRYEEKIFVAHPTCQKSLASLWIGKLNPSWVASPIRSLIFVLCLGCCYPFLALAYWMFPRNKVADFLQTPIVKFCASTLSYLGFIAILVTSSVTERLTDGLSLLEEPNMGTLYAEYLEYTPEVQIEDVYIRFHSMRMPTIFLVIWLAGMMWESMKKILYEGYTHFTDNLFNLLNFVMLCSYVMAFIIRFVAIGQVQQSIDYFSHRESWIALSQNDSEALDRVYWLDADRRSWSATDVQVISEVFYAMGSLLSIYKMTYSFTISERVGPLLLSLAKMFEDVLAFMLLFIFIIAAFVVAFHNLYWSTYEYVSFGIGQPAGSTFGSITRVIQLFFWSIFGLIEMDEGTFETANPGSITSISGISFFAIYNWVMIIILINMLIAMMSRSYDIIADVEDTEWKFARTKLYLEFMRDDCTLAAPFNLVPTWKGISLLYHKFADNWCYRMAGRKPRKELHKQKNGKHRKTELEANPNTDKNGDIPNKNGQPDVTDIELDSVEAEEQNNNASDKFEETRNGGLKANHTTAVKSGTGQTSTDGGTLSEGEKAAGKAKGKSKASTNQDKKRAKRKVRKKGDQPTDEYKTVMSEVVKRFTQKGGDDDGDEGGIEQLQTDLSSLRRELMSNIFRQDRERALMKAKIDKVERDVLKSRKVYSFQHSRFEDLYEQRVHELKNTLSFLDKHLAKVLESMTDTMTDVQAQMANQIQDTKDQMRNHIDNVKSGMEVINQGIIRQGADVIKIQGTLSKQVSDVSMMHGTLSNLVSDVTTVQGTLQQSVIRPKDEVAEEEADPETLVIS